MLKEILEEQSATLEGQNTVLAEVQAELKDAKEIAESADGKVENLIKMIELGGGEEAFIETQRSAEVARRVKKAHRETGLILLGVFGSIGGLATLLHGLHIWNF